MRGRGRGGQRRGNTEVEGRGGIEIRLGVPNYPGDTMTFSGAVAEVGDGGSVTVGFKGVNSLGPHVTGTAEIVLPNGEGR